MPPKRSPYEQNGTVQTITSCIHLYTVHSSKSVSSIEHNGGVIPPVESPEGKRDVIKDQTKLGRKDECNVFVFTSYIFVFFVCVFVEAYGIDSDAK